ncbi:membrane protein [Nostoc linckia z18]|uniref:Membrane protein n=2 Tax=Nostoc linckia TaxID=92942 RepID=A0A9Q5Z7D6_NOSLI|nr:hypothetical protein [Nostoc linckia]PHK27859.1 membrane protein [Nostoc linckia z15]PHK43200.1 membrane protein [Nostoc linckia z16]PHJ66302.1 membrane protein [Nostoc linckia z1]PHJ71670.1 membrane protein [Nostoc linckia z3]PHJ77745.1 membrane protein [Nostoc linckia z2]
MFARIRRFLRQFFNKSRKINNEPLNKVSLIVIIFIDIFILVNVFVGLDDISRWHISPSQAYPCYSEWQNYREKNTKDKDYEIVKLSFFYSGNTKYSFQQNYQQAQIGHLGQVDGTCLKYGEYKDKINNSQNQQIIKNIEQKQTQISRLEQTNRDIRAKYDSTLLEKIAGQPREQSINQVSAEKAKQELDKNNSGISTLKQENSNLQNQLLTKSESTAFLTFIKDENQFLGVEKGYKKASFWYPSIQLGFQLLFLLPLIIIALSVHRFAEGRGYGLISLISWHLLVIFFIPLLAKVFEFLQIGAIFQFIFDIISKIFGGLLFLINYVYILLIPLIGFGIIKFFQKFVFNPKVQAANRVQKSLCVNCAKKIRRSDSYCPHCGYYQYLECENCHNLTYQHLPYCKHCGTFQNSSKSIH